MFLVAQLLFPHLFVLTHTNKYNERELPKIKWENKNKTDHNQGEDLINLTLKRPNNRAEVEMLHSLTPPTKHTVCVSFCHGSSLEEFLSLRFHPLQFGQLQKP